jgi:hypothetical protein
LKAHISHSYFFFIDEATHLKTKYLIPKSAISFETGEELCVLERPMSWILPGQKKRKLVMAYLLIHIN